MPTAFYLSGQTLNKGKRKNLKFFIQRLDFDTSCMVGNILGLFQGCTQYSIVIGTFDPQIVLVTIPPPELCVDTPTNKIIIPISEKRDSNSRTSQELTKKNKIEAVGKKSIVIYSMKTHYFFQIELYDYLRCLLAQSKWEDLQSTYSGLGNQDEICCNKPKLII